MFHQSKTEQIKDKIEEGVEIAEDKATEVAKEAKKTADKVTEKAEEAVEMTVDEAKALVKKLKRFIGEKAIEAEVHKLANHNDHGFIDKYDVLKAVAIGKGVKSVKQCEKAFKDKPVRSTLAVAGVAALIGYLVHRSSNKQ